MMNQFVTDCCDRRHNGCKFSLSPSDMAKKEAAEGGLEEIIGEERITR